MAFPPVLSLSVGGRKHRKPHKARRSRLPVRLHYFLFVCLKVDGALLWKLSSHSFFFSSIVLLSFSIFPLPLLAAFTCTSLPYFLASLSSSSPLHLISSCLLLWPNELQTSDDAFALRYKRRDLFLHQPAATMPQKCTAPMWRVQQATGALTACNHKTNTHTLHAHTNKHTLSQSE